jgi:uncharacterized protein (TIGR04540 family)
MVRKQYEKYKNGTIGEIVYNPVSVKHMASQIILAVNGYLSGKISERDLKELILHYAARHGRLLFSFGGLNPTILNRIGKKRAIIVNIALEGFQNSII